MLGLRQQCRALIHPLKTETSVPSIATERRLDALALLGCQVRQPLVHCGVSVVADAEVLALAVDALWQHACVLVRNPRDQIPPEHLNARSASSVSRRRRSRHFSGARQLPMFAVSARIATADATLLSGSTATAVAAAVGTLVGASATVAAVTVTVAVSGCFKMRPASQRRHRRNARLTPRTRRAALRFVRGGLGKRLRRFGRLAAEALLLPLLPLLTAAQILGEHAPRAFYGLPGALA